MPNQKQAKCDERGGDETRSIYITEKKGSSDFMLHFNNFFGNCVNFFFN